MVSEFISRLSGWNIKTLGREKCIVLFLSKKFYFNSVFFRLVVLKMEGIL